MIHYIINTIAFQLFFLIIYDLFLKKETFFNWNRVYLLVTSVLSLIIPFIKINRFKEILPQDFIISLPEVIIGSTTKLQTDINTLQLDPVIVTSKSIWSWELILYAGMLLATFLFLFKIIKLTLLFFKNPKSKIGDLHIVSLLNSNAAFSCFNYIFLGERISEIAKASIIKHEMAHVKEKHTLDLLFFEVLRILFWFNPLVYMYQNRIMQLHEFLADKKALEYQSKIDYYENLLAQVFQTENISFINPFFKQSLIKKRIVMLQKSKSKQIFLLKYTLLIPMVLVMLVYTSTEAQDANNNVLSAGETELIPLREINMEVPFSEVDETPIFPGCEDLDKNEQKTCFTNKVTKHIVKNFNTHEAIQLGLIGRQRINVIFKINKDGNIIDVRSRAAHSELEKEAIDLIKMLPKMIPGKKNGENVTVNYSLPIILQIQDKSTVDEMVVVAYEGNSSKNEPNISKKNVPFSVVDQVPIFPGCESLSNEEQKACMSKNMASHVNKNFNTKLAEDLGLVGRQRIDIIFKINKEGDIEGIRCRAPYPELEKEAIRVINTLPKMIPGKHEGKVVNVPYSLPIIFQVQDKTNMLDEIAIVGYRGYSKDEIPFSAVDQIPLFPDCEGLSKEEQKHCMSRNIAMHVNRNFNTKIADSLNLKGRQQINVVFKINKRGNIVGIHSSAPHPVLENEAIRVIKTLPKMIPAEHQGKKVNVPYSLPIIFNVLEKGSSNEKKGRIFLLIVIISFKTEAQTSVLNIADSLYANGNYTKAIENYKTYKNQSEVYDKIAKAYIAIGNYDEALKNYKAGIQEKPNDALIKYHYAKLLAQTKKNEEASKIFNDLILIDHKNPNYHYELGLVLEKVKDSTAINCFRSVYDIDQTHQKAIYKIAKYYLQKRKHQLVEKYADEGLKVYKNNVKLISLKAQNYYWQHYYRKAATWFEKLIELGESSEFIHEKLSYCYYYKFEFEKAIEQRKLVLKYNKNDAASLYAIGTYYYELNDFVNAEKYVKQFLAAKDLPLDAEYSKLATIFNRQKKYDESIETLKKAIKENPNNISTHFRLLITKDAYYADLDTKLELFTNFKKKFPSGFHGEYIDKRISELKKEKFVKAGAKAD